MDYEKLLPQPGLRALTLQENGRYGTRGRAATQALAFLLVVSIGEAASIWIGSLVAFALYSILLLFLFFHAASRSMAEMRHFSLALTIIPLTRLVGFSLALADPLDLLDVELQVLIITLPLFVSIILLLRFAALRLGDVGLGFGDVVFALPTYAFMALLGTLLGFPASFLMPLQLMSFPSNPLQLIISVIAFVLVTPLLNEIIFHGLLLHLGKEVLGSWQALLFVSLLFATLEASFYAWQYSLFVFAISLYFGWLTLETKTIYPASLAHILLNAVVLLMTISPLT